MLQRIPTDIWITIFEALDEPSHLAQVVLTCCKFNQLGSKILLRYVLWTREDPTRRNLVHWQSVHNNFLFLPRRLKIDLSFDGLLFPESMMFHSTHATPSPANGLYDTVVQQISKFTMLEELILTRIPITPVIYQLVASLPKLRFLEIRCCIFVNQDPLALTPLPETNNASSITHLVLWENAPSREQPSPGIATHLLHRLAGSSLRSLTITWCSSSSLLFGTRRWQLPNLKQLELHVALLTRDLTDSALEFVNSCTANPRVSLRVNKYNVAVPQMASTNVSMRGLRSFRGPLPVLAVFTGSSSKVEHITITESLEINHLLAGLERLSQNIRTLDLQLRKYDNEVLFAIHQLFPVVESVAIRFGKGALPKNIMVVLGSVILPDLKQLRSLRLSMDINCIPLKLPTDCNGYFLVHTLSDQQIAEDNQTPSDAFSTLFDPTDLKDYLVGWSRYCPKLRTIQLTSVAVWHRRFEGDSWIEKTLDPPVRKSPIVS